MGVVQYNVVANDWVNLEFIINDLTVRVVGQQVNPSSTPTFAGGNITGDLGVGGDVDITGNLSLSGGLELPGLDAGGICFINSDDEIATDSGLMWNNTSKLQTITGNLSVSSRIGVGTTDPQEEVHVVTKHAKIRIDSDTTDGFSSLQTFNKDFDDILFVTYDRVMSVTQMFGVDASGMCAMKATPNTVMAIGTSNAKDLFFATNNIERLRISSAGAITTTGVVTVGASGLKILEAGATPTQYGIFAVPVLSGDQTYTFPAVSGYIPYSISGTYVSIDSYIDQAVKTTSNPSFASVTTTGGNVVSGSAFKAGSNYGWTGSDYTYITQAGNHIQFYCKNTVTDFAQLVAEFRGTEVSQVRGFYILEAGVTPAYYGIFQIPSLTANGQDAYYTFPATSCTIASTGDLTAYLPLAGGTMIGQITSTLAIGTSPFAVTSTTVNTNLNADLLDGQHGNYYQVAGSYQPLHANLTSISGMATTVGLVKQTSANTFGIDTTAYYKSGDAISGASLTSTGLTTTVGLTTTDNINASNSVELLADGGFDGAGWTGTNWTISGSQATHTTTGANALTETTPSFTPSIGKTYAITVAINASSSVTTKFKISVGGVTSSQIAGIGTYTFVLTATATTNFNITPVSGSGTIILDSISIKQAMDYSSGGIGSFGKITMGQTGLSSFNQLAIGTTSAPTITQYPALIEISTSPSYPMPSWLAGGFFSETSHLAQATPSFSMAGQFWQTSSGDMKNSGAVTKSFTGLFGGTTTTFTNSSSSGATRAAVLCGLDFSAKNAADWSPTTTSVGATQVIITYGLRTYGYLGYIGYTISGARAQGINYGGDFVGDMQGTYSAGLAGLNYGVYAATTDNLTDIASGSSIISYGVYINACGSATKGSGGTLTSWGLYEVNGRNNAFLGNVSIGKLTAPTVALDVAGAGLFSTSLTAGTGFGCNSKTAQTAYASGGALSAYATGAFGFDSDAHAQEIHTLLTNIRAALVANGIMN